MTIKTHGVMIKNIFWLLVDKLFFIALVFTSEGLISRTLGVELYGKWAYAINVIIVLSSLSLLASSEMIVPLLVRKNNIRNEIITSAFLIRVVGAFISFIFLNIYVVVFVGDDGLRVILFLLSFMLLLNEPFGVVSNYFQSLTAMKDIVVCRILALIVRCSIIYVSFKFGSDIGIYFSRISESLFLALAFVFLLYRVGFLYKFNKHIFFIVLRKGLTFWPPLILMIFYLRLDRFFIEKFISYQYLAMYNVAIQFIEQSFLLIGIIIQTISPKLIFEKLTRNKEIRNIKMVFCIVVTAALLIQIFGCFLIRPVILFVFGVEYTESAYLAMSMLPVVLFFAVDSVIMQYLYKYGAAKFIFIKWSIMIIVGGGMYYFWFAILNKKSIPPIYNVNYFIMVITSFCLLFFYKKNKV